jgi:hypothetical protein
MANHVNRNCAAAAAFTVIEPVEAADHGVIPGVVDHRTWMAEAPHLTWPEYQRAKAEGRPL